uniref:Sugar transporter SWEET1 n=1 Tax=Ascaris lumbricoides TaxID=6252 RepID=A0A0M3ICE5_ASCLU
MFEIFTDGVTLLNAISLFAFFTTVGLFFCGIGICRQVLKRRDTKEISGAPFMMGVVGGSCWWAYGYLKKDQTVLYVTSVQVILYSSYLVFYWVMTKKKLMITLKVAAVVAICSGLYLMVRCFSMKVYHPLGVICLCLNVADFAAPLANVKYVIRKRSSQTLPLPLCIANFLVSNEWFIYGLLKDDFYLILPNGVGAVFATINLVLFAVLPRKTGLRSPLLMLVDLVLCRSHHNVENIEAGIAEVVYDELNDTGDKKTWSDRMIANVTGEFGNVLTKCAIKDQFAYSSTLNKASNTDTDTLSASSVSSEENATNIMVEAQICTATAVTADVKKLQQLCRQLSSKLEPQQKVPVLKRAASAPNLTDRREDEHGTTVL